MIKHVADPKIAPETTAKINALLDELRADHALVKNDAELCRKLKLAPPVVSKLRHGRLNMSGDIKIRIHEVLGVSIEYIQRKLGVNTVNPIEE